MNYDRKTKERTMMFDMLHIAILTIGLLAVFSIGFYLGWLYKSVLVINYNREISDKVAQDILDMCDYDEDSVILVSNKHDFSSRIKELILLELDE